MDNNTFVYNQKTGELMHYGVLGMKWGIRKEKRSLRKYNKLSNKYLKKYERNKGTEAGDKAYSAYRVMKYQADQAKRYIKEGNEYIQRNKGKKNLG